LMVCVPGPPMGQTCAIAVAELQQRSRTVGATFELQAARAAYLGMAS